MQPLIPRLQSLGRPAMFWLPQVALLAWARATPDPHNAIWLMAHQFVNGLSVVTALALAAWAHAQAQPAPDLFKPGRRRLAAGVGALIWLATWGLWFGLGVGGLVGLLAACATAVLRLGTRRGGALALAVAALVCLLLLEDSASRREAIELTRLKAWMPQLPWLGSGLLALKAMTGASMPPWPVRWMASAGRLPVLALLAVGATLWWWATLAIGRRARHGAQDGSTWPWRLATALMAMQALAATAFLAWIGGWLPRPVGPGLPPATTHAAWWVMGSAVLVLWAALTRPWRHPRLRLAALRWRTAIPLRMTVSLLALAALGLLRLPEPPPSKSPEAVPRAALQDRQGLMLAHDVPAVDLWIEPRRFLEPCEANACALRPQHQKRVDRLLQLLAVDPEAHDQVARALDPNARFDARSPRVAIALGVVGLDAYARDRLADSDVRVEPSRRRVYPQAELFAHAVGVVQRGSQGAGLEGAERILQSALKPPAATMRSGEVPAPAYGRVLRTTLDRQTQVLTRDILRAAVQGHRAESAAAVVIDARSGAVRALVSLPDFDPNQARSFRNPYRPDRLFNHAVSQPFAVAELVAPLTAAWAMEEHDFSPLQLLPSAGPEAPVTFLQDLVAQAPPEALARLHDQWSTEDWTRHFKRLAWHDLPDRLGLEPGPRPAEIAPETWTGPQRPVWHQGLQATLMQVLQQYQPLAGDGQMRGLHLVRSDDDVPCPVEHGPADCPGEVVWDRRTARSVREMLAQATQPGGTLAGLQAGGVPVAGIAVRVSTPAPASGDAADVPARPDSGRTLPVEVAIAMLPAEEPRWLVGVLVNPPAERPAGAASKHSRGRPTTSTATAVLGPLLGALSREGWRAP